MPVLPAGMWAFPREVARIDPGGQGVDRIAERLTQDWDAALREVGSPELTAAAVEFDAVLRERLQLAVVSDRFGRITERQAPRDVPVAVFQRLLGAWSLSHANDRSIRLAPLLRGWCDTAGPALAAPVARERVRRGPMLDALGCLPFGGDASWLFASEEAATLSRVELLLWQAGSMAMSLPEFGAWLWTEPDVLAHFVECGARRRLRHRALAARALLVTAEAVPPGQWSTVERVLDSLAHHPSPYVWAPAACAMGRLAARMPAVYAKLDTWLRSPVRTERRRAVAALGSVPDHAVVDDWVPWLLRTRASDPWVLAALGPSLPYLATEASPIWAKLVDELAVPDAEVAWAYTRGLQPLVLRGDLDGISRRFLEHARHVAFAPPSRVDEQAWRLLWGVRWDTDFLQAGPIARSNPDRDIARVVENLVMGWSAPAAPLELSVAVAQLEPCLLAALAGARTAQGAEERGYSLAVIEAVCGAAALALFIPAVHALGQSPDEIAARGAKLCDTAARSLEEVLGTAEAPPWLVRSGLRALGHLLDAHDDPDWTPTGTRGPKTARALRCIERIGLPAPGADLESGLHDVIARAVDAVAATPGSLGPGRIAAAVAAWGALTHPGSAIPPLVDRASFPDRTIPTDVAVAANELSDLCAAGPANAPAWEARVVALLTALSADGTALGRAVLALPALQQAFDKARQNPERRELLEHAFSVLRYLCQLVTPWLADPVFALRRDPIAYPELQGLDSRLEECVAVRRRSGSDPQLLAEGWSAWVGPVFARWISEAIRATLEAHRAREATPPVPSRLKVGDYSLVRRLNKGGMGEIWVVTNRCGKQLVMKRPSAEALALQDEDVRGRIIESIVTEARSMRRLNHANVADFIESGLDEQGLPFVVLQLLLGVDLWGYATARRLTVAELKPIVADAGAGLAAIHRAGFVHRDVKPNNIFLRLDFDSPDQRFDPGVHRDPTRWPVRNTVVIDFGIARRAISRAANVYEGTLGFIPPEQAEVGHLVTPKADVYSLAATIYMVMTWRTFFDRLSDEDRCRSAHATNEPLLEPDTVDGLPRPLVELLRSATRLDPDLRPDLPSFCAAFATLPT